MTIQQMFFCINNNSLPEYIGFASAKTSSNVNQLSLSAPSAAQVGDVILIIGCTPAFTSGVSYSISGVTEVKDSNVGPNLYIGYKTLSSVGEQYTVLLNTAPSNMYFFSVAYRNSVYSSYTSARKTTYTNSADTVSASITPAAANSSIIGLVSNQSNPGNGTWGYTESSPSSTTILFSDANVALFRKEPVSAQLTYTFSSLNILKPSEIGLVAIRPI